MVKMIKKILWAILFIFVIGCQSGNQMTEFRNSEFKFQLAYPSQWEENRDSLPDKWAIMNSEKDVILVIAEKNKDNKTLEEIAIIDSISDLNINQDNLDLLNKAVKIIRINDKEWFNYAVDYNSKQLKAIISGTLCKDSKIIIVLVSNNSQIDKNKKIYQEVITSFTCSD